MATFAPPPAACPYAVVEVEDENDNNKKETIVFVVASKWLKDLILGFNEDGHYQLTGTIYWPSDENCLAEMLMKRPNPEDSPESWTKGSGKILQFFRTLGAAKKGAETAEYESSIESDGVIKRTKRNRNPPSRYIQEDSDDDTADRLNPKRVCNRKRDKNGSSSSSSRQKGAQKTVQKGSFPEQLNRSFQTEDVPADKEASGSTGDPLLDAIESTKGSLLSEDSHGLPEDPHFSEDLDVFPEDPLLPDNRNGSPEDPLLLDNVSGLSPVAENSSNMPLGSSIIHPKASEPTPSLSEGRRPPLVLIHERKNNME